MRWCLLAAALALAGCGIDGAPERPGGVTVGGDARIGVTGRL